MIQSITDNLKDKLNGFIGTNSIIMQNGFIESQFIIKKLEYSIKNEMLIITDEDGTSYLRLN